jgi:hypothetical protein
MHLVDDHLLGVIKSSQVQNLFVILLYLLVQILFDDSQGHINLFIHLNLVVPYTKHLGKLAESTVWVIVHKVVFPS